MGPEGIHAAAARQEGIVDVSSYKIISRTTHDMPAGDVLGYIYSKWLRSLRYENDFFRLMDAKAYWPAYQLYIFKLLSQRETMLRLAVLTEEPDVILGFSVFRGSVLDYVYVHRHQRQLGIGTKLLPPGVDTITHLTTTGMKIWGSKYGSWKFNPFA